MVLSIFWTGTWLRQWYITSWILALLVAILANHTNRTIKRRYRLELELDLKDEGVFDTSPTSLVINCYVTLRLVFIHVRQLTVCDPGNITHRQAVAFLPVPRMDRLCVYSEGLCINIIQCCFILDSHPCHQYHGSIYTYSPYRRPSV